MSGKTINELLEEFNDPPFTAEDYKRELAEVNAGFLAAGVQLEDIEPLIRNHDYIHDGGTIDTLAERWISLMAFKPYIDEE